MEGHVRDFSKNCLVPKIFSMPTSVSRPSTSRSASSNFQICGRYAFALAVGPRYAPDNCSYIRLSPMTFCTREITRESSRFDLALTLNAPCSWNRIPSLSACACTSVISPSPTCESITERAERTRPGFIALSTLINGSLTKELRSRDLKVESRLRCIVYSSVLICSYALSMKESNAMLASCSTRGKRSAIVHLVTPKFPAVFARTREYVVENRESTCLAIAGPESNNFWKLYACRMPWAVFNVRTEPAAVALMRSSNV